MKKRELKFIYNSQKKRDREGYGLITALEKHIINELDISRNKMTETQLAELADVLKVPIPELVDSGADHYTDKIKSLSDQDTLTMIHEDMTLLKTPIVIREDGSASLLLTPFELHPADLAVDGTEGKY